MFSFSKAFLALGLLSVANLAQAAIIELNADHFSVSYDDAQAGPYKQGLLSGSLDTVYFQPNTFSALSGGSQASTQASLQLTFTLDPGYTFAGFTFTERGDYFLFGQGAVNAVAGVQAVNADTLASVLLNLAAGTALDQTGASAPWELSGNLTLPGLGAPHTLLVTLDNTLFADAPVGSLGFIQKTYVGFRVLTEPAAVPEPSALALLLAGMMAALLVGRRRVRAPAHDMRL